jgi:hypothetical protein
MADNLRKYTLQEVLNKVYTDSSGISIGLNSQTAKETLNAVLDSSSNSLNVAVSGGTITGDLTVTGDFKVEGGGSFAYDEIVEGTLQVLKSGSGTQTSITIKNADTDSNDGSRILFTSGTSTEGASIVSYGRALNSSALAFNTGGNTERVRITEAGLIGIGTSSPSSGAKLHIVGDNSNNALKIQGGGANVGIEITRNGTDVNAISTSGANLIFATGSSTRMLLNNTGLGIGTTSPSDKLEVYGNGADTTIRIHEDAGTHKAQLHLRSGGNDVKIYTDASDNNKFHIDTESVSKAFTISTDGKIGIGESSPSTQLIHGKINTSGSDPMLKLEQAGSGDSTLNFNRSSGVHNASIGSLATDGSFNISLQHNIRGNIKLKLDSNSRISLSNNDSGSANTIFGYLAGNVITSGGSTNTAIAQSALQHLTTGDSNTAVGYRSLRYNVTGSFNTAIGTNAMLGVSNQSHSNNTAVGYESMYPITTGGNNTALGYQSLRAITSGSGDVGLGVQANYSVTTGVQNVAVGQGALFYNQTGHYNTAIGGSAMGGALGNSHENNTAVGYSSLNAITTGNNNTALGFTALQSNTTANYNLALGYRALRDNTTSGGNVAVGASALQSHVSGNGGNIAIGESAMSMGTGGKQRNNAIGYRSQFQNNTGIGNVSNGYQSMYNNVNGDYNVAIGFESMKSASGNSHSNNVAIGRKS